MAKGRFRDRPTGELMVLLIATTICTYILVTMIVLFVLAIWTDRDLSGPARNIADIINTLIGLLAGFLAGRTDTVLGKKKEPEEDREL
jgi:hypothetical protein